MLWSRFHLAAAAASRRGQPQAGLTRKADRFRGSRQGPGRCGPVAKPCKELGAYFHFYNNQRPHQTLGYRTPAQVFFGHPEPLGKRPTRGIRK